MIWLYNLSVIGSSLENSHHHLFYSKKSINKSRDCHIDIILKKKTVLLTGMGCSDFSETAFLIFKSELQVSITYYFSKWRSWVRTQLRLGKQDGNSSPSKTTTTKFVQIAMMLNALKSQTSLLESFNWW